VASWTLTIRDGPRVRRERFATAREALAALEDRLQELAPMARRDPVNLLTRRIEPVRQVAARAEISGPRRRRGGIDLRGDGSTEAYTGRLRRSVVEPRAGETAYAALARVLPVD
jgi:hypothetical protein